MNENEFRKRLSEALGEPPSLAAPVLSRPDAQAPRAYPRTLALLAGGLAILLVLVLVASRIALHPTGSILPAARQWRPIPFLAPCPRSPSPSQAIQARKGSFIWMLDS